MKSHLRASIQPGLKTLKTLWKPFVAIQLLGLAIVLSYFYWPPVTTFFDRIGDFKARVGLAFAAIVMPIAGGFLPEMFKSITRVAKGWDRERITFMLHGAALFCVLGVVVELFYIWLDRTFGVSKTPGTVITKMVIDQFIYSVFLSVPVITFSYTWRRFGYRLGPALSAVGPAWYLQEAVPVMIVSWAYWIPMGLLMYTLPPKITFIYGAIGNAACATLLTAIAGRPDTASKVESPVSMSPISDPIKPGIST